MKKVDWRTLFEAVGLLAIVLSLIFVGLQVRQDQLLARSTLGAGTAQFTAEIGMMAIESEFQKTFVKMIFQPDQLTDDEIVEANWFLSAQRQVIMRECYLKERGVFVECDAVIRGVLRNYFENQFAKNWWQQASWGNNPYVPNWINDKVAELDSNGNRRRIEEIRESFE